MQQNTFQRKTLTERVIHAVSFEGLATLILAPTAAWLMSAVAMTGVTATLLRMPNGEFDLAPQGFSV